MGVGERTGLCPHFQIALMNSITSVLNNITCQSVFGKSLTTDFNMCNVTGGAHSEHMKLIPA